ncbi:MAG: ubiquitin-like protein Pup [Actinobacteria bacterium]|nr:ubiquitin-like protein Pup [Actinomycetota bacterium]MCL6105712.1 ubiquitin-like protein Pup [Actinomycetota bacterium]
MTERELKKRPTAAKQVETTDDTDIDSDGAAAAGAKGQNMKNELDGILDEIDQVIEENAEEFVHNYVQKGGE